MAWRIEPMAVLLAAMLLEAPSSAGAEPASAPDIAPPSGAAAEPTSAPDVAPRSDAPPGPPIVYTSRPGSTGLARACSARLPICVHARPADASAAIATLGAFERAWETLTEALAVPTPDLDPSTLAYDVFLDDDTATLLEARDVRSRVDRGRAFTIVDRRVRAGCMLDALAATELARASLFRVAPATEEGTARAQANYLAELAVPCSTAFGVDAAASFQAHPDRAFCDAYAADITAATDPRPPSPASRLFTKGASLFWSRLDWAWGAKPGALVTGSWALHPTMTPVGAVRWLNEPDTFDVLRTTFKGALTSGGPVSDLWLDFGVNRAFIGSHEDGFHTPELRTIGDAGAVPLDWDLPWPTTPRRLAARTPVHPTGASYLAIRHAGAAAGARLRVEIEWEEHALFRWALVKVDAAGRELGRVVIATPERATHANQTLVDLDAVDRVLLVGVNAGDPAYAFDPDDEVWEPHGWLVTVAEER